MSRLLRSRPEQPVFSSPCTGSIPWFGLVGSLFCLAPRGCHSCGVAPTAGGDAVRALRLRFYKVSFDVTLKDSTSRGELGSAASSVRLCLYGAAEQDGIRSDSP